MKLIAKIILHTVNVLLEIKQKFVKGINLKYKNLDITIEDVSVFVPAKNFKQTYKSLVEFNIIRMTTKEPLRLGSIRGV